MGIHIGMTVSTHVSKERWEAVYEEALDLAQKLNLADCRNKEIHGHVVRCLVPTEETEWNGRKGFWAVADYSFRDSAEGFFFPKELYPPEDDEPVDILALRAMQIDAIHTDIPSKNYQHLWDDKTQGHFYHISLLAVGCLVQDRLGDDALVHSDINAGQCRRAVKLANKYLDHPIRVPCQCDIDPWFDRISRVNMEGTDRVRIAVKMFIGRKNAAFGEKLRSSFPHDLLVQYWKEEFADCKMNTNGFAWNLKDYLSMGFDVGELCDIVCFKDEHGKALHEQFIGLLMDSKLHWKEKDCSDWMVQDPESPALESIESLMIRFFASGSRNKKVDRYIPLDELRRILRDKLGNECDTDALVDAYLREEKELEAAGAEKKKEKDQSGELNRIMNEAHDEFAKTCEDYDIPVEHYLPFYEPGNTIEPKLKRLMQRILAFADTLLESDDYRRLAVDSVDHRETWLISASDHLYGDLRDMDWEQILSNIEKDTESFPRYYSLFCIELNKQSIRYTVIALIVNDDLYAYARGLPLLENKED